MIYPNCIKKSRKNTLYDVVIFDASDFFIVKFKINNANNFNNVEIQILESTIMEIANLTPIQIYRYS